MDRIKTEVAFLIYNLEFGKLKNNHQSYVINELNRKINKYTSFILDSSYKHVNNFSYSTNIFHYFYKVTEYYILKYFNSIIVDSIFYFKCINDLKNKSHCGAQNDESKLYKCIYKEKNEKMLENWNNNDSNYYTFDYQVLTNFIQNLKKLYEKNNCVASNAGGKNITKAKDSEKTTRQKNDDNNATKPEKCNNKNEDRQNNENEIKNASESFKFGKTFIYAICEINNSLYNKKNRMICITKIFRKIVNKKKMRKYICENDKMAKKMYLKFILNLSLGIFIYLYMYRYIKKKYKNIDFFIFLNNLKNIRQIYSNNTSYFEKQQIISFIKYIKFINIQMFQYAYISFFVNIYKYINLIHNTTLVTLYYYFKKINKKHKWKIKLIKKKDGKNSGHQNNDPYEYFIIEHDGKQKCNESYCHDNKNVCDKEFVYNQNISNEIGQIEKEKGVKNENVGKNVTKNLEFPQSDNANLNTKNINTKLINDINNKRAIEIGLSGSYDYNNNKQCNIGFNWVEIKKESILSMKNNINGINEIIFDNYIYVFIFYKYIRNIKKSMKYNITKIQSNIKKMIHLFINICKTNNDENNKMEQKMPLSMNTEDTKNISNNILGDQECNNNYINDSTQFLIYFKYIELCKYYKSCIKINYEIIKSVHTFHILLTHFFKYFPVLNFKKGNCIIYNYYDKSYIYKEQASNENIDTKKAGKVNKECFFDIFKNVKDYEIDFLYFNEYQKKKDDVDETLQSIEENNQVESFSEVFHIDDNTNFDSTNLSQNNFTKENINDHENTDNNYSNGYIEGLKKIFLYCINNNLNDFLISVNMEENFQIKRDTSENEKNISIINQNKGDELVKKCRSDSILEILKTNKALYSKILEIIEGFSKGMSNIIQNYEYDLNRYSKKVLDIYDNNVFDIHYKISNQNTIESEEEVKNKKLLEVKIFLDYKKLYNKKTVETQTPVSFFKNDKAIQIAKDTETITISEQFIQTRKNNNPIFYLSDIYS
ncbi:conserved Plasmodium protein, unknown function [Plasmodium berghei]|uniref:Uncharacterized protein n=2 Tax=Plasmodium berghei TaxID=5821 RepID=A0A509AQ80_PLABA|nr:conserved Plasmodium protein, unknown function [Plasmodium berghei ANKA]CXJ15933.1 conserved Plasmodium protein, unknown function [Plasmodium berghei]SCM26283.1 conserved Plasmodium protein, unknown function [Plasmodium berghei]SCN28373.1 conserved Plasmodium protein, unknown function [Plasmodium berghei]SCO62569.1 conserved Plasmodium protein, unknown function [Plasmodium berghei]SCO64126.1 conserved Plasmodium protein, unknown function [Plasmodium berghei]|eukprot:XP_034424023.1 conserved Plasmodium protein, unknown function [Plasmodium berghei ANKA]